MRFVQPVAVFYSRDGGEYWVGPPYAGKLRVFGPWTADAIFTSPDKSKAVEFARRRAEPVVSEWVEPGPWKHASDGVPQVRRQRDEGAK